ncbi:divisome protein SepX/GlpR [Streptacidiphilus fuscans]|uniref:Uncharacterized protein n=1 Tax=Streptacidiphilus fuscans TaxID=2789292 RepID=A0A931FFI4_9ACTN|nr:hypothetical protein [Streptacidiphilus fuscans]MBF9071611.1 hypothetical protein [Streptacidiphilus fuscans]MBF9072902.1 hypothetical protein [Streptacidiphilus fuscans]
MSSSGLIYAVIVGAWAAYLVPMWLRRQDELNEARPTERFSTAIRLLSGRAAMERKISRQLEETQGLNPPADLPAEPRRPAATPPAPSAPPVHAAPSAPVAAAPSVAGTASRRRAALLARRRRMVMVLFAAFTVGMVVAAVGGVALLWIPAVPAVLFSLYIAQMRRQERRRYEVKLDHRLAAEAAQRVRQQAASRRVQEAETVAHPAPPAPSPRAAATPGEATTSGTGALAASAGAAGQAARTARSARSARPTGPTPSTPEPWADDDRPEHASPSTGRPGDDAWNPVPVPLPTYVTAPVAPRATLGLDLSAPDTYSSARAPRSQAQPPVPPRRPVQPPATPLFDQYADDAPRAANE